MTENKREFPIYVIRIIDKYTILINYGTEDNQKYYRSSLDELTIHEGQKVKVFQPGEEIIDPITKESLGFLDLTKATLEITEMFEHFSICKKIISKEIKTGLALTFDAVSSTRTVRNIEPISINESQIEPLQVTLDSKEISIMDPVSILD